MPLELADLPVGLAAIHRKRESDMSTSNETKTRRVGRFIGFFLILVLALGAALLFAPNLMAGKAAINALPADTGVEPPVLRDTAQNSTIIDMAGNKGPVLKGELYDRFRSNSPLSVIEKERPGVDLSWFKTLDKERKHVGFKTYSPNFYYRNSSITRLLEQKNQFSGQSACCSMDR